MTANLPPCWDQRWSNLFELARPDTPKPARSAEAAHLASSANGRTSSSMDSSAPERPSSRPTGGEIHPTGFWVGVYHAQTLVQDRGLMEDRRPARRVCRPALMRALGTSARSSP